MIADERYERWVQQIDRITQETYWLHHHRQLFRGLAEITQAADPPLPSSVFFDAIGIWYVATQGTNVRRQLDRTRGTVSLARLLDEVAHYPGVMTRQRHLDVWTDPEFVELAHANFDLFSGARERDGIDVALVRADLARLEQLGGVVQGYVNDAITHTADQTVHAVPTFDQLNAAIDAIGDLVKKYASFLKAVTLWQFEPIIQEDWRAPFRRAWIPPETD
jgi:hypothetical protein